MTVKEVAEALDVSYVTALRYVKSQIQGAIRRGGRWYVPVASYEAFKRQGNRTDNKGDK